MQLANSTARYGAVPQIIHWLTAIFVICGFLLGQFLDDFPKGPVRNDALIIHMTLGQCVAALLVLRFVWRYVNAPPPAEPTPLGGFLVLAARASHFALYALLLAVPLLGIMVQLKRGHILPVFGVWDFASPWPADRNLSRTLLRLHAYLADTLLILAGIHAVAALVHHWVWRDRTLTRMLPGAA
jgi:cytochrome b561